MRHTSAAEQAVRAQQQREDDGQEEHERLGGRRPDHRHHPGEDADADTGDERAEQVADSAEDDHREDDAEPLVGDRRGEAVGQREDHACDRGARAGRAANAADRAAVVDAERGRDRAILGEGPHAPAQEGVAQHEVPAADEHQREGEGEQRRGAAGSACPICRELVAYGFSAEVRRRKSAVQMFVDTWMTTISRPKLTSSELNSTMFRRS